MEKTDIFCKFYTSDWFLQKNVYGCFVESKTIPDDDDDTEFGFFGEHAFWKDNADVVGIRFTNCEMTRVPQGLINIFPNLKHLFIENSNIQLIKCDDLREYSNIIHLALPNNEIQYLPGDLFAHMRKLEAIDFTKNLIEIIEPNILDRLNKLKYVSFFDNSCFNMRFDQVHKTGNMTLLALIDALKMKFNYMPDFLREKYKRFKNVERSEQSYVPEIKEKNEIKPKNEKIVMLKFESGLLRDLKKIIENEKFKDFVVKVGDEEFKVHKFLLAARSPVLAEIIENNFDAEELNLTDISIDIFREILNFIYTDELPKSDQINLIDLFAATGQLKIKDLHDFAAENLMNKVNEENAFEIMWLANKHDNKDLKQKSFEIIKRNFNDEDITDDLIMQPEKLKKLIDFKKKKEKMMMEMELEFKKLLKENY